MAERQNWRTVQAILDFRNARHAIDLFNGGSKGREELAKYPDLNALLLEMSRAQAGDDALNIEQALEGIAANHPQTDDEED